MSRPLLLLSLLLLGAWQTTHAVEVRLRTPDGAPVSGVAVALVQAYTDTVIGDCVTDRAGMCRWQVPRGLYVVRTGHDLDLISAAALAESGLPGLALTVGDEAIGYTLVVAAEALYFDRAPEAAMPQPYIPTMADLTAHYAIPTPLPGTRAGPAGDGAVRHRSEDAPGAESPAPAATTVAPPHAERDGPSPLVQLAVATGVGCALAAGVWLLVRLVRRAGEGDR